MPWLQRPNAIAKDERLSRSSRTSSLDLRAQAPREQGVMKLVATGMMNKAAAELGLAEMTVKIYRGHVMRKMRARSLADLIRMTGTLGIRANRPEQTEV